MESGKIAAVMGRGGGRGTDAVTVPCRGPVDRLTPNHAPPRASPVLGNAIDGASVCLITFAGMTCLPPSFPSFMSAMSHFDMSTMLEFIAPAGATPMASL